MSVLIIALQDGTTFMACFLKCLVCTMSGVALYYIICRLRNLNLCRAKAGENQRRVMVLEEFLHTALLYQATNTRNINVVAVLEQYLAHVEKE